MNYDIISTEIDEEDGDRLIEFSRENSDEVTYRYASEIHLLEDSDLKRFLLEKLPMINSGAYDRPMEEMS